MKKLIEKKRLVLFHISIIIAIAFTFSFALPKNRTIDQDQNKRTLIVTTSGAIGYFHDVNGYTYEFDPPIEVEKNEEIEIVFNYTDEGA